MTDLENMDNYKKMLLSCLMICMLNIRLKDKS